MKCKCCSFPIAEIEKKYGISIYKLQYYAPKCGTYIETKKKTEKGIGFRKWVKNWKSDENILKGSAGIE